MFVATSGVFTSPAVTVPAAVALPEAVVLPDAPALLAGAETAADEEALDEAPPETAGAPADALLAGTDTAADGGALDEAPPETAGAAAAALLDAAVVELLLPAVELDEQAVSASAAASPATTRRRPFGDFMACCSFLRPRRVVRRKLTGRDRQVGEPP